LDSFLASGADPELFSVEDREDIHRALRPALLRADAPDTREAAWAAFARIVRGVRGVRVALCLSPGDALRVRCRRFPSLLKHAAVDWCGPDAASAAHGCLWSHTPWS